MPIRSFPTGSLPTGSFPVQPARGHDVRKAVPLACIVRVACVALAIAAAAPVAAQQAQRAPAGANANGANAAAGNGNADARAVNDSLRGVSREDSLLGGPGAYSDPYRAEYDAGETGESDLMKAERVPNGTTAQGAKGYDPLPPGGRKQAGRAAADAGGVGAGGGAGGGNVAAAGGNGAPTAGPADTAQQAAKSLYSEPFGGAKGAAQQIYHTPW